MSNRVVFKDEVEGVQTDTDQNSINLAKAGCHTKRAGKRGGTRKRRMAKEPIKNSAFTSLKSEVQDEELELHEI